MKTIEVDDDLYRFIASQTQHIGESASDILRRLINMEDPAPVAPLIDQVTPAVVERSPGIVVSKEGDKATQIDEVKEMRTLLISDEFASLKKAIERFMLVLSTLHRINPSSFSEATQVKGRKRVYFADNQETLLANGKTTKPKAIPNSPFWVITNNNTSRKRQMVEQLMSRMNYSADIIEKVVNSI